MTQHADEVALAIMAEPWWLGDEKEAREIACVAMRAVVKRMRENAFTSRIRSEDWWIIRDCLTAYVEEARIDE